MISHQTKIQFDRFIRPREQPRKVRGYIRKQSTPDIPLNSQRSMWRDKSDTKIFVSKLSFVQKNKDTKSYSAIKIYDGDLKKSITGQKISFGKKGQSFGLNPENHKNKKPVVVMNSKNTSPVKKHDSFIQINANKSPMKSENMFKKLSFKSEKQKIKTQIPINNNVVTPIIKKALSSDDSIIVPKHIAFKRKQSMNKKPILDDFIKGKQLGKGYFGEVFLVKHKQIGFVCAMKIISRQIIRKQKTKDQIVRQLKISLFVNHVNIVQTYGYFSDDTNFYILQQLMTEEELYKTMKKNRIITQKQTAHIVNQILSGLQYLHSNNITHRDIKPQNILVQRGIAKLCDFGWAVYDPDNFRTSNIGTLLYLSPQNVKGEGYDRRNDIWGIGILTYQMLVGNVPFSIWGEDEKHKIIQEQIKFPFYQQISDVAKDFILRMLEKNPDNRASIEELQTHPFLSKSGIMDAF